MKAAHLLGVGVAGLLAFKHLAGSGSGTASGTDPTTGGEAEDGDSFELGGGTTSVGQGQQYWDAAEETKANEHFWGWAANELLRNDMDASGIGGLFSGITQLDSRNFYTLDELVDESDSIESPKQALEWYKAWQNMGQPMTDGEFYSPPNYDNQTGQYDTDWLDE